MTVAFFIGLILLSHPGRLPVVVSSNPLPTLEACEADVFQKGLPTVKQTYAPAGWVVENAYCTPVSEADALKEKGKSI